METPQREGVIHAFFAERTCARLPDRHRVDPGPLAELAVIGGGTMGAGIAVCALGAGLRVVMLERDAASAQTAPPPMKLMPQSATSAIRLGFSRCTTWHHPA